MNDPDTTRATALLEAATADLTPDLDRLVAGGIGRGRVLRRRRRVMTTFASAAAIGVIGAGASVALQGGGSSRAIDPADTTPGPATPTASGPAASGPRRIGFDVTKTAAVLESLLPEGEVRGATSSGSDKEGQLYRSAHLLFRGAMVEVSVEQPDVTDEPMTSCRAQPTSTCTSLEDGSALGHVRFEPADQPGVISLSSTLYAPDQFVVHVSAYNVSPTSSEPVSEEPVLTQAQLDAIATDAIWFDEPQ